MSHPIQNMPAGYRVEEVRHYDTKEFDVVVVDNYAAILEVTNYATPYKHSLSLLSEYTTAIFRIKWKN